MARSAAEVETVVHTRRAKKFYSALKKFNETSEISDSVTIMFNFI
jgi:hypothetical protein